MPIAFIAIASPESAHKRSLEGKMAPGFRWN